MRFDPDTPLLNVDVQGNRQHYLATGAGEPVLLIHGSLCDCRYWKPQMAPLARRYHIVAPSLRHHWPAATASNRGGFTIAQHAQDIADLIAELQLGPVHLVGHSRGARVALELALRHTDSVHSLVLADPGVSFDGSRPAALRSPFVAQAAALVQAGETQAGLALFVDSVNGETTWSRMVEGFRRMATDNAPTLAGQAIEPLCPVAVEELSRLQVPTLLIGGAASPARYAATLDELEARLPQVSRLDIQGAAHGMNLAKPHSFNTAVNAFLGEHAIPDATS